MRSHNSLCVGHQTGVFSNNLIALASDTSGSPPLVWLVNSNGNPTLPAQIEPQMESSADDILEGVISLPNNTNQWGPWAGKILTGDEDSGILYTTDTNGVVTPYDLGIAPDDFAFIPSNQDLYVCDQNLKEIFKVSKTLFTNHVGYLLISQEGEGGFTPELFIVNWDPTNAVFVSRAIDTYNYGSPRLNRRLSGWHCSAAGFGFMSAAFTKSAGLFYMDQTEVFSNDLIALASQPGAQMAPEVWLINSIGNPTLLAQIVPQIEAVPGDNLEGVITLPDNTNQWGPWAGKILTGDEDYGILYTIDTNETMTPYDLGIASDDFTLIPTNEDLYVCDQNGGLYKVSKSLFGNYAGDLLISQEGNPNTGYPTGLFIVSWNWTNFVSRDIDTSAYGISYPQEDATFAPLNLPSQ